MGLFSRKKEKPAVDTYNHFSNATVPKEWIKRDGKQYFRKHYYYGIEIDNPTKEYLFFHDCDPLWPKDIGERIELYFYDILAGILPARFVQMYRDFASRGDPVEIQVCAPSGGRIVSIRIAFYTPKDKLNLLPETFEITLTNSNEDDVLKIDDLFGDVDIDLDYDYETERFEVYADKTVHLGNLSKLKSKRIRELLEKGYQGNARLLDLQITDDEKAVSKIQIMLT